MLLRAAAAGAADGTVVFNEIMYHPETNEAAFEWVELHNQMAVDMDLSGWSLDGGVAYAFPEGTVVAGGGYLVVALSPPDLAAAAGITNVTGPFTGRLGNDGARLTLRNNNRRLMDEVEYGQKGEWPVAPDGAGPSLAKIDEDSASADAANWTMSAPMGGTPGTTNFPHAARTNRTVVRFDSTWRYQAGGDPGTNWRSASFDASAWSAGAGLFYGGVTTRPSEARVVPSLFSSGLGTNGAALAPGLPDPHYALVASAYSTPPPPPIAATVVASHPAWLTNDPLSRWVGAVSNGLTGVPPGAYTFRTSFDLAGADPATVQVALQVAVDNYLTNVLLNGAARGIAYSNFNALSPAFTLTNGFAAGANTLDFLTVNGGAIANPGAFRVKASALAVFPLPTNTPLAPGAVTRYFRAAFVFTGDVATATLALRAVVDDGAVFSLNGAEILRLNMPAGAISSSTYATANIGDAALSGPFLLPAAPLVTGTNVLAVEVHQAATGGPDVLFGAELMVESSAGGARPPAPKLAFNELPSVTNQVFWVEIVNYGAEIVAMTNYVLKRFGDPDREYTIPARTVAPGGFVLVTREDLGYGADPGDALVLYAPGKAAVVDAVVAKRYPRARFPDGAGAWRHPAEITPGATNRVAFHDEIVINEIMYHPRDPQGPPTDSPEQWIELYNRGAGTVDLEGWRIDVDGETAFTFPAGRSLAAGGYLVVARDAAWLGARYPAADILGNLSRRLSRAGARIELYDQAGAPADAAGNLADAVRYLDGNPWPAYADGLGASLELRDPRADNARPEAWSASDDRATSAWQTYTYRATAAVEAASSPTNWREFVLGLIGEGEVLLDDIHVVQQPDTLGRELLQNCTFESGTNTWRLLGNHRHSDVIVDPDQPGNHALRLVSDGYTEHMHNHAETTLGGGAAVTNGFEYEISFRAKWVAGGNRLNARLYFNRLARVTEIAAPALCGTPGGPNSTGTANVGPTFAGLRHSPVVPTNDQLIAVTVDAADPDGIAGATLCYAVNGGAWQMAPMAFAPSASGVTLAAGLPGQAPGSIVQFYVNATDSLGAGATCPPGGTNSRALFRVSDGTERRPRLHSVRLVLTPADTALMHTSIHVMSNERLGCTVIADERTAAYNARIHLQGSERGRDDTARVGFTVRLPADRPYRGVFDGFTIDRSGGYAAGKGGDQDEILLKHAINRAGGLPGMYDDLCQVFAPRTQDDGTGLFILAKYDDVYLDGQYENGGDGEMYKLELIYYPTSNVTAGDVQSPKLPRPDLVLGTDIKDLGDDPEAYRWTLLKENHTARNHYAPMVALAKAFSQTGSVLDAQTRQLMDVDEWMRAVAFLGLIGAGDMYTYGNSHNLVIYFRPEDGRGMAFPWDMDYAFVSAISAPFPGTGSPNTTKLISLPANLHAYYGHLYDLSLITGDATYLGRWAQHYAGLVGQTWTGAVTYLAQRAAYVRSVLPLATPFAIGNNQGNGFSVSNGHVTLYGTAAVTVREIFANGTSYPITWTTATNWSLTVPLWDYANLLALQGVDLHGAALTGAVDSITVTNLGAPAPRPVVINEWMADNAGPGGYPDPADGLFQDWLELFNPNSSTVDLSGCWLTDNLSIPMQWAIPSNTVVGPRGFLLVWADGETNQNGGAELHASFKLAAGGEALGIYLPDGVRQHAVAFGAQTQNISQGLFPDGDTNTAYAMAGWTPGASNRLDAATPVLEDVAPPSPGPAGVGLSVTPGHLYGIQIAGQLIPGDWTTLSTNRATGPLLYVPDPASVSPRFYRAVLIP